MGIRSGNVGPADIQERTRTDHVYRSLLGWIQDGVVQVDSKLPTELELAQTFAVSRPIVRAAIARLRNDDIVRSVQGSGTRVVRMPALPAGQETSATEKRGVTVKQLQRCFEFRVLIEGEAAHWAALRHNPQSFERMSACVFTTRSDKARGPGLLGTFDFHRAVLAAADSPFLEAAMDDVLASDGFQLYLRRGTRVPNPVEHLAAINAGHLELLRLIERRQADDAREAMRRHIQNAYDNFMEVIPLLEGS